MVQQRQRKDAEVTLDRRAGRAVMALGSLALYHLGDHKFSVSSPDECRRPAEICAPQLCRHGDLHAAQDALEAFFQTLFNAPAVRAVALLSKEAEQGNALTVVGFVPLLDQDDLSADAVEVVSDAAASMGELHDSLVAGVRFVNCIDDDLLSELEHESRIRWKRESKDLLALVVFKR